MVVLARLVGSVRAPAVLSGARAASSGAGAGLEPEGGGPVELRSLGGGVTLYGLRAPRSRNALSGEVVQAMREAHLRLRAVPAAECRAVVLHSLVPGVFCAGADLKERRRMDERQVAEFVRLLRATLEELARLPQVTVAALAGPALGGGLELALACDLRVAAGSARLGLVETARGLLPGAGGTQRLPRLLGPGLAKELIFTARVVSGAEAARLGLVNRAVELPDGAPPAAALAATLDAAVALAREVAANAPLALRHAKRAIDRGLPLPLPAALEEEQRCYEDNIPTRDRIEGMQSFIEKRPPVYEGR